MKFELQTRPRWETIALDLPEYREERGPQVIMYKGRAFIRGGRSGAELWLYYEAESTLVLGLPE